MNSVKTICGLTPTKQINPDNLLLDLCTTQNWSIFASLHTAAANALTQASSTNAKATQAQNIEQVLKHTLATITGQASNQQRNRYSPSLPNRQLELQSQRFKSFSSTQLQDRDRSIKYSANKKCWFSQIKTPLCVFADELSTNKLSANQQLKILGSDLGIHAIGWFDAAQLVSAADKWGFKRPQEIEFQTTQATLPLHPLGTHFQHRVWQQLQQIKSAHITNYSCIGKSLTLNKGAQAVGQAVGANPISLLLPCHRVASKANQLSGYRWGIVRKITLLAWEIHKQHQYKHIQHIKNPEGELH